MEIIFHERSIGENFNNFPRPNTSITANLTLEQINDGKFDWASLKFEFSAEAHSNGWWAKSNRGGTCRVTIWDGETFIG